jgi:hypothetical protein
MKAMVEATIRVAERKAREKKAEDRRHEQRDERQKAGGRPEARTRAT